MISNWIFKMVLREKARLMLILAGNLTYVAPTR